MTVKNLGQHFQSQGYGIYLPALSTFYVKQLNKLREDPVFYGQNRLPAGFEKGYECFDFLGTGGLFSYPWALYSAGHAQLDLTKGQQQERMVHNRNRQRTTLLGDSSGFQIAKGTGHFKNVNWEDFAGQGGDEVRAAILNWLEHTADWSMTLDIPALSAEPPLNTRTGLNSFQDTLDYTLINLEYFLQNRTPGRTRFLNVLSGSSSINSQTWYQEVSRYSDPAFAVKSGLAPEHAFEGYAFAGVNRHHMKTALERILDLIDDDLIANKDWIHFLGIGRLDWACYLTSIQRQLRKHHNPNLTISFDAASPFVAAAKGLIYTHNVFTPKRWGYNMEKCIDERSMAGSTLPMPFGSPITDLITVGDICQLGVDQPNRQGKIGKTSWDTMSYLLIMAHSVYNHIYSVMEANRLVDYEMGRELYQKLKLEDWQPSRRASTANDVSDIVPGNLLYFNLFVEKLFDPSTKNPRKLLEDYSVMLEQISFGSAGTGTFNDLFGSDDTKDSVSDMASQDHTDLLALEEESL